MSKVFRNSADLQKFFEGRVTLPLQQTQKIVHEAIQDSINEYYKEKVFRGGTSATPLIYDRIYKLLNSVVKTDIVKRDGYLYCEVKIDENYLNYQYPGTDGFDGIPATGQDVLDWNSEYGSHGGTVDGDWKIWEEAMQTLSGNTGIMLILKRNLQKYGLNIK